MRSQKTTFLFHRSLNLLQAGPINVLLNCNYLAKCSDRILDVSKLKLSFNIFLIGIAKLESKSNISMITTCFALSVSGEIITGDSKGVLMIWKGNNINEKLKETHQVCLFLPVGHRS